MAKKNTPETGHAIGHFGGNEAETHTKSVSASMLHAHFAEKNVSKNLIFYTNCGIGTMRHFCNTLSFTIFAGQTVKPIRAAGESVLGFARRENCKINCVSAGQSVLQFVQQIANCKIGTTISPTSNTSNKIFMEEQ